MSQMRGSIWANGGKFSLSLVALWFLFRTGVTESAPSTAEINCVLTSTTD